MADSNDNKLADMIDQIIDTNNDQAQQCFHDYLKPKLQSTIQANEPDDKNED